MHESFREYVEALHPSFERLLDAGPVKIKNLPRDAPSQCIYLFSEGSRHLYVGRTKNLRQRLRQHSIPASQHNQAVFAFRLARETTGSPSRDLYGKRIAGGALRSKRIRFCIRPGKGARSQYGCTICGRKGRSALSSS